MKATTKFQIQTLSLSKKLKPITLAQENWAIESCIEHISICNKDNIITCLHCSNTYKDIMFVDQKTICPSCNIEAKKKITKKRIFDDWSIFAILDTIRNIQVIRYFKISANYRKGEKAIYSLREVSQLWMRSDGKFEIYANQHLVNYYQNNWVGGFEIRNKRSLDKYDIAPYKIYPKIKLIKEIKRTGYKLAETNLTPLAVLQRLLTPTFETIYKAKQTELFYFSNNNKVLKYWNSIKICIRNNYKIDRADIWFDYLNLLEYFNKDLSNPKYICPESLELEHDRLVRKKNEIFRRKSLEEQRQRIEEDQVEYYQEKSKYFELLLTDGDITIEPIKDVKDFFIIGNDEGHCIFSNKYYKRRDSLILIACDRNKNILETIELSIKDCSIRQSYGKRNKITPNHEKIKTIINSNTEYLKRTLAS